MRKLDRYVGRTVLTAICMVLLIIVGLDAVAVFVAEAGNISESYSFGQVSFYILLTLPGRFYEFIPFAALIGCLIGLGQLASSSELVVMRSAGVSVARLVWSAMKPALFVAVLGGLTGEYIAPKFDQLAESSRAIARNPDGVMGGRQGLWHREGNSYVHFNALESNGVVHGISLLQFDEKNQLLFALSARRATYQGDYWMLEKVAQTHMSSWETRRELHQTLRWDTGITPQLLTMVVVEPEQLPIADLYRYSRYLQVQGLDSDDFQLALWRKILQPVAVAALVLVAISFIFGPLRDGTMGFRIFSGVLVGIVFQTSQDMLGPASLVFGFAPVYAALAPILICFAAGLILLRLAR